MNLGQMIPDGQGVVETALSLLNHPIFTLGGRQVTLSSILVFVVFVVATWIASRMVRRTVNRAMRSRGIADEGTRAIAERLTHYMIMAVGIAVALDNLGINLAALFAAGAFFGVAVGFAMQNITQNFVSGLILLVERAIKPGDVVQAEGRVVIVQKMGLRTTVARTRDEEEIIIPNSSLVQSTVINYTLRDSLYRVRATVGVSYGSNMKRVMEVLAEAVQELDWRLRDREPTVFLKEFGTSSVDFEVSVWMQDPWSSPRARSDMHNAVWHALKAAEITIAFPQIDVHFDPPVTESLEALPRAS